jgi:hypothetical protein
MSMETFEGAVCGCCGAVFGPDLADETIRHAGMVCGPVMRLPDEVGAPNDGQPCPHGDRNWLGNPR